jgi:hypothetical protein
MTPTAQEREAGRQAGRKARKASRVAIKVFELLTAQKLSYRRLESLAPQKLPVFGVISAR